MSCVVAVLLTAPFHLSAQAAPALLLSPMADLHVLLLEAGRSISHTQPKTW